MVDLGQLVGQPRVQRGHQLGRRAGGRGQYDGIEGLVARLFAVQLHVPATIGLTGEAGGRLGELSDVTVRAPAGKTDRAQEYHLYLYHALCEMLEITFYQEAH